MISKEEGYEREQETPLSSRNAIQRIQQATQAEGVGIRDVVL